MNPSDTVIVRIFGAASCCFRFSPPSLLRDTSQSHLLTKHVSPIQRFPENGNTGSGNVSSINSN